MVFLSPNGLLLCVMMSFSRYVSLPFPSMICELVNFGREQLLQDQLRQAKDSVSNMQKLHELAQSQLFELRAQSGYMLNIFHVCSRHVKYLYSKCSI